MFCKDCGAQLAEDARFCPNCGSAQAAPPAQTVTPPAEPENIADKVRATTKKIGSSTAFLIAIICLSFVQVLELFALMPTGGIFEMWGGIIPELAIINRNPLVTLENMSLAADIIGMLPGLLITLGLWITFFSCAGRKPKVNTSGLTTIFVVTLVQMVLSCLTLLAALIPLAFVFTGADALADALRLADDDIVETILLVAGLVFWVIFAFVLIYNIKICTTISNIRSTLKTGVPNKKASRFVAIMCYISGGICLLSGIFWLLSAGATTLKSIYANNALAGTLSYVAFLSAVTSLLTAAAQIIFGALIFTYRRKIKALEEEDRLTTFQTLSHAEPYTAPVYIPPEPAVATESSTEELDETKRWDL